MGSSRSSAAARDAVERLTADLGKDWDIVQFLAIKLWPGAHPLSGTVEAAMNAVRQANVAPDQVAKILVAGPNRSDVGGSRRPKDLVEAIHSLPYFVASAVADKEFTWVHATEAKIFNPVVARLMQAVEVDPAPPAVKYNWGWGGSVTIVTTVRQRDSPALSTRPADPDRAASSGVTSMPSTAR